MNYSTEQKALQIYYSTFYPYDALLNFINAPTTQDYVRDIAVFLKLQNDDSRCIRPVTITNRDSYIQLMLKKLSAIPIRLDMGAVTLASNGETSKNKNTFVSSNSTERPSTSVQTPMNKQEDRLIIKPSVWKELVFDIDLTDYDLYRTCCSGKSTCDRCWPFVRIAALYIVNVLKSKFAYRNIKVIFSGGRGLHIWVKDEKVGYIGSKLRASIVSMISLIKTPNSLLGKGFSSKRNVSDLVDILYSYVEPEIEFLLAEHKLFQNDRYLNFLQDLSDIFMNDKIVIKDKINKIVDNASFKNKCPNQLILDFIKQHFNKFELTKKALVYPFCPILDESVSVQIKHLLKLPYSIHPSTKNVSVPLSQEQLKTFNPTTDCPNLTDILSDVEKFKIQLEQFLPNL